MNFVTTSLKSGLLIQLPYPRFETMADISTKPDVKPMMAHIIATVFKATPTETYQKLIEQLERHQSYTNPRDMFTPEIWQEMAGGKAVLFATQKMAESCLPSLCPTLGAYAYALKERPYQMQLLWYFVRTVPKEIQDAINIRTDWLNEHKTRWYTDYKTIAQNRYFCYLRKEARAQVSDYEALNVGQFSPFILLYLVCSGAAILSFVAERVWYRIQTGNIHLKRIQTANPNRRRRRAAAQVFF
ncbi:hypothetical protein BIW11_11141 [Tropilaelaps mercedesae]|uniref:Uncharacterized protein n=1 Tax=Tropilaelaps mercedesae TaxID=418985 RepID=A0A1V9XCF1_9ACAR|nr:hypothetical protein BIW11_11141 [Tropilaelaps mercedesae]